MKAIARQGVTALRRTLPAALLHLLALPAFPPAPGPALAAVPTLPVDEIRPGMRGHGRTVFEGTRIDTFGVEVLGVLRNATPRGDLIIVRAEGGPLARSGIIAGMSGSPIYVDGKLVGALAYGWDFAAEPIAGITPIGEMIPILSRGPVGAGRKAAPGTIGGGATGAPVPDSPPPDAHRPGSAATLPRPIGTPLSLSGFTPDAVRAMEPWLRDLGFQASVGGGAVPDPADEAVRLEPGSAVGVQFVTGDASVAAIGTVTWIDGDRVLAFGHPLFDAGTERYPMTTARIQAVLPSLQSSFKMGTAIRPVGVVDHDFATGIAGSLGPAPELCPATIEVRGPDSGLETYGYRFLPNRFLAPGILGWLAFNSFSAKERSIGESWMKIETTYRLRGREPIVVSDLLSGTTPPATIAEAVTRPAALLLANPLEEIQLEEVSIRIELEHGLRVAAIREIGADREVYRPGEEVRAWVTLKPWRGAAFRREVAFRIPADADPGRKTLRVCDGSSTNREERERAPGRYQTATFDDLRRILAETRPSDALVVRLATRAPSAVVNGREFPGLPPSVLSAMAGPNLTGARSLAKETIDVELVERTGWVLSGCLNLDLKIEPR